MIKFTNDLKQSKKKIEKTARFYANMQMLALVYVPGVVCMILSNHYTKHIHVFTQLTCTFQHCILVDVAMWLLGNEWFSSKKKTKIYQQLVGNEHAGIDFPPRSTLIMECNVSVAVLCKKIAD